MDEIISISSLPECKSLFSAIGKVDEAIIKANINTREIEKLKLSDSLKTEILWKVQTSGKEAIYSSPIIHTLSSGIKALIYVGWDWFVRCVNSETGELIWKFACQNSCYGKCTAYTDSNNFVRIFASSHDGKVYCLNELGELLYVHKNLYDRENEGTVSTAGNYYFTDSNQNWCDDSFIHGNIVGGNSTVEIVSGKGIGQVKEISGVENNKIWLFDNWDVTPNETSSYFIHPKFLSDKYFQHSGSLSLENGVMYNYITGFDSQIVKILASTGEIIFKYSTLGNIEPYVYVTDNEIISVSLDRYVYSFRHDGSLIWKTLLPDGSDAFLNIKYLDNLNFDVLVSCRSNKIYVINGLNGVIKCETRNVGGDIDARPLVDDSFEGFICGSDTGWLGKYNMDTCENEWSYNCGSGLNSSAVMCKVGTENLILQCSMDGLISFLTTEGKLIKSLFMMGGIESTPCVENYDGYSIAYFGTLEGFMYCVKVSR